MRATVTVHSSRWVYHYTAKNAFSKRQNFAVAYSHNPKKLKAFGFQMFTDSPSSLLSLITLETGIKLAYSHEAQQSNNQPASGCSEN